jgi:phasin family protein
MPDSTAETANSAEKAYAAAASQAKPVEKAVAIPPEPATPVVAAKTAEPKKKPAMTSRKMTKPARKPAAKNTASAKAAKRAARVAKAAAAPAAVKATEPKLSVSELKEKIMATAKNTADFTQPMADAVSEFQSKAKAAYEKSAEVATEVTELTKGNVEAFVESGKIFAAGAQSLGKTYAEEAKSAYETMTADMKELAAVKSPTELFQLQGKIARRNFDALVATGSKNTEAFLKLANDAFAPLTGRVEVATEKLAKVA